MARVLAPRPWSGRRLHFVGAGGCGMSGLALVAQALGARVSGADRSDGRFLARLRARGVPIAIGHDPSLLRDAPELAISSAIPRDDPDRALGRELGLREIRRGDLLAEVAALRDCIAVAGTHGKTTTAAMLVHALRGAGVPADYAIGGDLLATGRNAEWRGDGWLVVETDESDRSALALAPRIAVLTNVDHDHVGTFVSLRDVERFFSALLERAEHVVVAERSPLRARVARPATAFAVAGVAVGPFGVRFRWRGREVRLRVPGVHNACNAAAALEAACAAGADPDAAVAALADFPGVARRQQCVGRTADGALVYDDYAHHPTAVAATLAALRTLAPRRLVAVLQPWGLARVQAQAEAFGVALCEADLALVLELVPGAARPADHPGVSSELIVAAARAAAPGRPTQLVPQFDAAVRRLAGELHPGTACVTLGCGDVHLLAERLVAAGRADAARG